MQEYMDMITKISIFMIVAGMLISFRIKKSHEKYLKVIVGLMVVAQVMGSVSTIMGENKGIALPDKIGELGKKMEDIITGNIMKYKILDNDIECKTEQFANKYAEECANKYAEEYEGNLKEFDEGIEKNEGRRDEEMTDEEMMEINIQVKEINVSNIMDMQ